MDIRAIRNYGTSSIVSTSVLFVTGLLVWSAGSTWASAQTRGHVVIRAQYVETKVSKDGVGTPEVVEEGTCFIDPAGRYRVERIQGRRRTAEVVDLLKNRRTALDLDRKLAVSGSTSEVTPGVSSLPGAPIVVESGGVPQRERGKDIGTKVIAGGLTVEGTRFVFQVGQAGADVILTFERWFYRFSDPRRSPLLLEQRFEDNRTITIREVTDVSEVQSDESLFAIPADFMVSSRPSRPVR